MLYAVSKYRHLPLLQYFLCYFTKRYIVTLQLTHFSITVTCNALLYNTAHGAEKGTWQSIMAVLLVTVTD